MATAGAAAAADDDDDAAAVVDVLVVVDELVEVEAGNALFAAAVVALDVVGVARTGIDGNIFAAAVFAS